MQNISQELKAKIEAAFRELNICTDGEIKEIFEREKYWDIAPVFYRFGQKARDQNKISRDKYVKLREFILSLPQIIEKERFYLSTENQTLEEEIKENIPGVLFVKNADEKLLIQFENGNELFIKFQYREGLDIQVGKNLYQK